MRCSGVCFIFLIDLWSIVKMEFNSLGGERQSVISRFFQSRNPVKGLGGFPGAGKQPKPSGNF
jgi:hypothetical protein